MNIFTDLDIAKKMASGEIDNIVATGSCLLVPMRITGTGITSRKFKNKKGDIIEYQIDRPESSFLSQEFLDMCAGLPVCLFHSGKHPIDYTNYKDYVIGNIFYPYIKDTEVWGVAKIYDLKFLDALDNDIDSTSPFIDSNNIKTDSGIYEEDLKNINHVAFVSAGHWDTDKPAIGNKKIIFEEEIPVNENTVETAGAELSNNLKVDSANNMESSEYRNKILKHNKTFDPVEEDVVKTDADESGSEKPKETETETKTETENSESADNDTSKVDECGTKKVDAAEVVAPSNMEPGNDTNPMDDLIKKIGSIADAVSSIGARVEKLESGSSKPESGTSESDTENPATETPSEENKDKEDQDNDIMNEDDEEKDEIVDATTSLSDSAKGYVSVKVPRARRTETSLQYMQRVLIHNKEFLDDKYGFLLKNKIDSGMKSIASEAFDSLRDRVELERQKKMSESHSKKPGPHYIKEAPGVERDMDFLRGRA